MELADTGWAGVIILIAVLVAVCYVLWTVTH